MQEPNTSNDTGISTLDIKKFLFRLLAHWYLFIVFMAAGYFIVHFKNQFVVDKFSVRTTILITNKQRSTENILGGLRLFSSSKNLQNEIGVLKSYDLNRKTVKALDMLVSYYEEGRYVNREIYKSAPFVMQLDTAYKQRAYTPVYFEILSGDEYKITGIGQQEMEEPMRFGEVYQGHGFKFRLEPRPGASPGQAKGKTYFCRVNSINGLTKNFTNRLKIQVLNQSSSILWLWIDGRNAQKDADYINELVQQYINIGLEEKNHIAEKTVEFIDSQLKNVADSLTIAQDSLQDFRMDNEMLDPEKTGGGLYEKLEEQERLQSENEMKIRYLEYLMEDVKGKEDLKSIIPPSVIGVDNQVLLNLINELRKMYQEKELLNYSIRKKDMPTLDLLEFKINNTKEALLENIRSNKKALEINIEKAKERKAELAQQLKVLPQKERKMRDISRKYNLNDNIYTYLLQKRAEAGITLASNQADVQVLDKARARNASRMQGNKRNPMVGLVLGFMIPLAFVVLKDYFNTTIVDRSDVESHTKIPILGSVGHKPTSSEIPVYEKPKSAISEAFRALRTNLQYMLFDKEQRLIALTSTVGGEGKTFTAINLAAIISMSNNKTLLIGLDLRKPRLQKHFEINNNYGVSNYLIGQFQADEVIHPTHIENLYVAPPGPMPPNPAELIESKKMADFIEYAKSNFDYIIADTPPIALVTDALLISQFADANIFVIRQDYSNKNVLKLVNELYDNQNIQNLSILINDVKISGNYGAKYAYKYGYRHGLGYGYGSYSNYGYYDDQYTSKPFWQKLMGRFGWGKGKGYY